MEGPLPGVFPICPRDARTHRRPDPSPQGADQTPDPEHRAIRPERGDPRRPWGLLPSHCSTARSATGAASPAARVPAAIPAAVPANTVPGANSALAPSTATATSTCALSWSKPSGAFSNGSPNGTPAASFSSAWPMAPRSRKRPSWLWLGNSPSIYGAGAPSAARPPTWAGPSRHPSRLPPDPYD